MLRVAHSTGIVGLVLCFCLTIAANARSTPCATNPADQAAVADTLRNLYKAAAADDLAGFNAVVAPGFYAFDGGTRFDGDAIMKAIGQYHAKGVRFVWTVTQPDVHVHCDEAWIAYVNQGSIQMKPDSAPIPTTWVESAVLERKSGGWKLVFFHSTRVEAAK